MADDQLWEVRSDERVASDCWIVVPPEGQDHLVLNHVRADGSVDREEAPAYCATHNQAAHKMPDGGWRHG